MHGVDGFAQAVLAVPDAARLAEIDVAVQLAQDHHVEPATISGRNVEASISSGNITQGR